MSGTTEKRKLKVLQCFPCSCKTKTEVNLPVFIFTPFPKTCTDKGSEGVVGRRVG